MKWFPDAIVVGIYTLGEEEVKSIMKLPKYLACKLPKQQNWQSECLNRAMWLVHLAPDGVLFATHVNWNKLLPSHKSLDVPDSIVNAMSSIGGNNALNVENVTACLGHLALVCSNEIYKFTGKDYHCFFFFFCLSVLY
jgi:hypothetical protein